MEKTSLEIEYVLFDCLRQMELEALPNEIGEPTGLCWYGGHARPDQKRPQTETNWSRRLCDLLNERGVQTEREVRYPGTRWRCDLRIFLRDNLQLWLEIKGAWKSYWLQKGGDYFYRSYLFHPLLPELDEKSHSAAQDIDKLRTLSPNDADFIGFLLLGFGSTEAPMHDDVTEFERLAGLHSIPWSGRSTTWADPYRENHRTSCWMWISSTAATSQSTGL